MRTALQAATDRRRRESQRIALGGRNYEQVGYLDALMRQDHCPFPADQHTQRAEWLKGWRAGRELMGLSVTA